MAPAHSASSKATPSPPLCYLLASARRATATRSNRARLRFADLAGKLARLGSTCAALFIDYGHTQPGFGDTLQAIAGHRYADPLQAPGQADITAQVDFAAFAATARASGLSVDGPVPQGEFLGALGAIERASRLMAMNPGQASQIETSIARLMSPGGMGSRFQAIGVRSENISPLPALGAVDMARAGT